MITWLHLAGRNTLEVHPHDDPQYAVMRELAVTKKSGQHRESLREISGTRLRVGPIEAVDGIPVVDIKRPA